jgi:hypothetical protein
VSDPVKRPGQIGVENPPSPSALALGDLEDGLDSVMAATARPESVGPRFEPCFSLGLHRVHDPSLMDPVEDHRNPERSLFAARLGDIHPSHGQGLERVRAVMHS